MSIFADILAEAFSEFPGAKGAVFTDREGEAVDSYSEMGNTNIRLFGAHWGIVFYQCYSASKKTGAGEVDQLVMRFSAATVVIQRVTEDYFVVVALADSSHLGRALGKVSRVAAKLREQM